MFSDPLPLEDIVITDIPSTRMKKQHRLAAFILTLPLVLSQHGNHAEPRSNTTVLRNWGPWTGWSTCSETCGFGVTYRLRQCHAHYRYKDSARCDGPSKQYKICIIQNCTNGKPDYRATECQQHNNVYYGQQTYIWVPYINDAAPCELSCKSVGYRYYARFNKTVSDFVICNEENTAVCIQGHCVSSGCDGVLGSDTRVDGCGVCGGDGTSCRPIHGIFTRTHMSHRGYNIITTIPQGACSINITEMSRSNNHLALSTSAGYFLNGDMRLQAEGNIKGAGTLFTYRRYAPPDCPGECLTAPGPLNTTLRVELIYLGRNPGLLYQFTIPRGETTHHIISSMTSEGNRDPLSPTVHQQLKTAEVSKDHPRDSERRIDIIPRVRHGKSPVYVADTDEGDRLQQLQISSRDTSSKTPAALHDNHHPSESSDTSTLKSTVDIENTSRRSHQDSNKERHSDKAAVAGEQLYVEGQNGSIEYKHYYHTNIHDDIGDIPIGRPLDIEDRKSLNRMKEPVYLNSNSVDDNRDGTAKHQSLTQPSSDNQVEQWKYDGHDNKVSTRDRYLYSWRIVGFTECTEPCGGGLQQTRVACVKRDTQVEVIVENCDPKRKQVATTIVCNNQPCQPRWHVTEWTACSVTCGRGLQKRVVECKQRISPTLTLSVSVDICPHPQPQATQLCQMEPCFTWYISKWSKCSSECGFGQRKRAVTCVDKGGNHVRENLCTESQPIKEEICDMGSCAQGWYHTKWSKQCSSECGRGHYSRQVYCSAAGGARLHEEKCGGQERKPRERKTCKSSKPCGGQWFTGPWFQCNATCGSDVYRHRDVLCIKRHGKRVNHVVKEHNCNKESKPSNTESCGPFPKCEPQWYIMAWSECSQTCGSGIRTREVKCIDASFNASSDCDNEHKPLRRQSCNQQTCTELYAEFSESPVTIANDSLQMDGLSVASTDHPVCEDTQGPRWCQLAKQARLCTYLHYRKLCCHTCKKLDSKPHI